ncbi:ABC transporter ATP-binding protein [Thermus tengchongensis]|uniref:ABC transporter ATP-binding protein n=1 Tax=Thermus tengchongensis TaxID=1214928 RepID=A0A4Y9FBI6_9DEIN|nr:ABC transporter ATP-binding protein [Thermus tengchongensis]TFU26564.1 ABC transporter ATP-binding protein [Thermus tengchongensis]
MLEARGLGYRAGGRWLLRGVDLRVAPGEFWAVLGPNGSGKTTLLRLLAGELRPAEGEVFLQGRPLAAHPPEEQALRRAVLSQSREMTFPFTAYEVVFLGRLPHLRGRREGPEDHQRTQEALGRAQALPLAERLFLTLSGGEAMRVEAARLLAQEPLFFLLDEPTNHLDPRYALELLGLFRALASEGRGVLAVLHDLNLAALFADRLLLLKEGRPLAQGSPQEVLRPELLEEAYGVPFRAVGGGEGPPLLVPVPRQPVPR